MLFNSTEFLFFLPIVFALYWLLRNSRRWQNLLVLASSYVFYGWWDWRFLLLIAFTSSCSFLSGLLLEKFEGNAAMRRTVSAANIVAALGVLGFFKYFNFFAHNAATVLATFGMEPDWPTLNVVLPVGISFYTFQALSYSIDVYRRRLRASRDVVEFFAYISFFPQLVAGPIERATNLLPQFQSRRAFSYHRAVDGCRQMLWGFFKKVVVADTLAALVNEQWAAYDTLGCGALLLIAILFAFQIYGDFSGYSDIAIGCARLFGIELTLNFRTPYFAKNIGDFWRRWHVSLMTWFRDYVYIPLGGSREGLGRTLRNILVVWTLSGLWHGAEWTFVVWGTYHALLLCCFRLWRHYRGRGARGESEAAAGECPSWRQKAGDLLSAGFTFLLVVLGWIVFRAENLTQAADYLLRMATSPFGSLSLPGVRTCLLYVALLVAAEWLQRDKAHALALSGKGVTASRFVRWTIYYALIILVLSNAGQGQTFIYFQF